MGRGVLWTEELYGQGSPMGRGALWAGESNGQESPMGRGALWAEEPYGQESPMGRRALWAGDPPPHRFYIKSVDLNPSVGFQGAVPLSLKLKIFFSHGVRCHTHFPECQCILLA